MCTREAALKAQRLDFLIRHMFRAGASGIVHIVRTHSKGRKAPYASWPVDARSGTGISVMENLSVHYAPVPFSGISCLSGSLIMLHTIKKNGRPSATCFDAKINFRNVQKLPQLEIHQKIGYTV